ncbi:MAG: metallophosphoesterase [Methanobacteriaceae archaeon]|nr:metallophosphoesterase [Methanobacteriaceae archaeon]
MFIGVISDTHIPDRAPEIPQAVFDLFSEVDMILHAGDLTRIQVLEDLNQIAPTKCVQGNMDRAYGIKVPRREVINVEKIKIGLDHGEVYPRGDTQQLKYIAMEMDVDVLISGHTHWAFIEEIEDVILLNPGSPTVPRLSDPSVMLVTVEDGKIDAEIKKIGNPVCKALNFKKEVLR